jgi:hypothetical protein
MTKDPLNLLDALLCVYEDDVLYAEDSEILEDASEAGTEATKLIRTHLRSGDIAGTSQLLRLPPRRRRSVRNRSQAAATPAPASRIHPEPRLRATFSDDSAPNEDAEVQKFHSGRSKGDQPPD